ncbi:sortilin-like isoform X4 [Erpetoichthys calabaricus]|uniref:sortilin-like isoform X2 n=1 Tax=Erpetoichthys calabaricus TaxID=27687 RepID=UPI00223411DE|nr:sortilin-like isoform X2 [Erpetoichthys calabaricus]XP_051780951.1 sortilin-like isoform X1 [Erpetoichthys calabaricus]XP_051780953.1 sortilin-like isoform X4 [Erpetoichthys calabaricus]
MSVVKLCVVAAFLFPGSLAANVYAQAEQPCLRSGAEETYQRKVGSSQALTGSSSARRQRSSETSDTCKVWQGYEIRLRNNTHPYQFIDLSGSVSLAWVGDGTGVVLALTTFQVPLLLVKFGQSKLYRSENYGKSFSDVSDLINNTFIRTEFGIAIGPDNSGKVILTGEVSGGSPGGRIFRSLNFGYNFTQTDLPFHPLTQVTYNPRNASHLLVLSIKYDLWISLNFGETWKKIHDVVCLAKWDLDHTIFFTTNPNGSCIDRGMLILKKTSDFGESFKTVGDKIYSFGLGGRFVFASVMTGVGTMRRIHVSVNQGETWNMAQLPPVGHEQFYSILAANDDMVFMHVDEQGDTGFGTIFVSDDRGIIYSKSLERHLYTTTGGDTDFTNVTSLRGVYMTSVLAEDGSVQTVITFDQGGEWNPIQKPENGQCDSTAKDKEKCSLHIHATYSMSQKLPVPMLPLSEPNAVGLVIAHGSVGDAISLMTPDVYVSDDGGYSWTKALNGPHHYAILDSGGLIVAVEHNANQPIKHIKFSTDEGQCWYNYTFTEDPIYFTGLASEPGARSMNVSIWGYRDSMLSQFWVSITIDFKELLTRDCDMNDYVQWLAHSSDLSNPNDGCILGYKEKYLRLRKSSVCWNGRDYIVNKQPTTCPCSLDDFLCDFGYYRTENSSICLEQPDLKGHDLEFCLHGKEEMLKTNGYRKIPGDQCQGGKVPERKEIDLRKKCVSTLLYPSEKVSQSTASSALVIAAVITILLLTVIAGVIFVKKYVCGGRFLVHRYSILKQHAEANGIDGVDELDINSSESNRQTYHDDSDEDLLE